MKPSSIIVVVLLVLGAVAARAQTAVEATRFTFPRPTESVSPVDQVDSAGRMHLDIAHWSTDTERDRVIEAMKADGPSQVPGVLRESSRLGTLHWPGGTMYAVHYARKTTRPDGGTDVVLLLERPLWLWWQSQPPSTTYPFELVQLRLDRQHVGEARAAIGSPIVADPSLGVALADFTRAMPLLSDVRQQRKS